MLVEPLGVTNGSPLRWKTPLSRSVAEGSMRAGIGAWRALGQTSDDRRARRVVRASSLVFSAQGYVIAFATLTR